MPNQLIQQGTLNRLKATVVFASFDTLNITPGYLGKEGVNLALEGNITEIIETMTGNVPSPEPYVMIRIEVHLLKPQSLAALFKAQWEANSNIGDYTIRPDVTTGLTPFPVSNGSITNVGPMILNGSNAEMVVSLRGSYYINSDLWD